MNGICHIEIPCQDMEKAGNFYKTVFGWEITPMPEMKYSLFKPSDGPGGGFSTTANITGDPGVFIYIEVEDIDATLKKIEENGGKKVKGKTMISEENGNFAIFLDIEGNSIGLWSK
jgi:predicted enzyme related to lactoylglutathione lyase